MGHECDGDLAEPSSPQYRSLHMDAIGGFEKLLETLTTKKGRKLVVFERRGSADS